MGHDLTFENTCRMYTAPILTYYVWWVLREAKKRNIDRLYFLARDGSIMKKIAELLCEEFCIPISCRYLYVSRAALRMPTYHFIDENEAYSLLLGYSYQVSAASMMKRALLPENLIDRILDEVGYPREKRAILLTRMETDRLAEQIKENGTYRDAVWSASERAYPLAMDYFRQEGLLDKDVTVAIVDSGWNGSMQRSLRQLLDRTGCTNRLVGFYFGLFYEPSHNNNSEYLTWYFSPTKALANKVKFSNNLFECICAAPHGTTLGYMRESGRVRPILGKSPSEHQNDFVRHQIKTVLQEVPNIIKGQSLDSLDEDAAFRKTQHLVRKLMYAPTKDIVDGFKTMLFCDDIYESYYANLADTEQFHRLRSYTVLSRIRESLRRSGKAETDIPWPYGVAALLPPVESWWYRSNILAWELLKNSPARMVYKKLSSSAQAINNKITHKNTPR